MRPCHGGLGQAKDSPCLCEDGNVAHSTNTKVQSGSDTLLGAGVFSSLREKSVTEQRQSVGQSWKPSPTYQSLIREQASRKISIKVIHVLTSCPPRSAFLKSYRTLHSLHSLQTFSNGWQRKVEL